MYASITKIKVKDMKAIAEAAKSKELPDLKAIPGFIAYYVIPAKKHYTTVAIFNKASSLDTWRARCRQQMGDLKSHFEGPAGIDVVSGEVLYSRTAKQR